MIILDGGMGRELERMGAPFAQPEWSAKALLEKPESVLEAHTAYVQAGADVITTNSYALVPFHIGEECFNELAPSLLTLSGKLASEAKLQANHDIKVAASIPPMFGSYKPALFDAKKATPMLEMFADCLCPYSSIILAETMSSKAEIQSVMDVFFGCGKPLWISMSLQDEAESGMPCLRSGEKLIDVLPMFSSDEVDALLFNCSQPEVMLDAVTMTNTMTSQSFQIGVYANAFPPLEAMRNANEEISPIREELTPERYFEFAHQWQSAGASIIGGCCGIGPEHIKKLNVLKNSPLTN